MTMVNGIGTRMYGRTWHHDGSYYITTEWFCILWLPVYPIRSFKVYSGSGPGDIAATHEKGEVERLPDLYRPHLKAYLFTTGVMLIAAVWILSGPVSESDRKKQPGYLENQAGLVALEEERYDAAVTLFEVAVKSDEQNHVYRYNLAQALFLIQEYERSLNQLSKAVSLAPRKIYLYSARAKVFSAMEDFAAAAEECKKGLEIEAGDLELLKMYGDYSTLAGDYGSAIAAFSKTIDIDRYNYQPYLDRAYVYYLADDLDRGLADIDTALARDPNIAEIKFIKALILAELKHNEEALNLFREIARDSVQLSPEQLETAKQQIEEMGPH